MANAIFSIDPPANEPVLEYRPGSDERNRIEAELQRLRHTEMEIPLIIGGQNRQAEAMHHSPRPWPSAGRFSSGGKK